MGLRICVVCNECGTELSFKVEQIDDTLTVYPTACSDCIKYEKEQSYKEGLFDSKIEGGNNMEVLGYAQVKARYMYQGRIDVFKRALETLQQLVEKNEADNINPEKDYIKIEYIKGEE